jgi:hypothetical protein
MFATFIADACALIAATRALFGFDNPSKDSNSVNTSINNVGPAATYCGWMIVCHNGWDNY